MKVKKPSPVIVDEDIRDSVSRFNMAFNQIKSVLVDRETEIEALKLAIVTGNNLMLDGPPGTSKSRLADEAFKRIEGAVKFKVQLMPGTQPDQLFGPMKTKKYREEAVWEHNTEEMLPEAHFAFIDEVYRGSALLLPSILSILNEHTFSNGSVTMQCPLITAIGTTNFVTDAKELDAFHDRWVLRVKVSPLESNTLRIKMLKRFLDQQRTRQTLAKVSLDDIQKIRSALRFVDIDDDCFEIYEDLVSTFRKKRNNLYVSDRRLCLAMQLAQAALILNKPEEREVEMKDIASTIFGIVPMGDKSAQSDFVEAYDSVVDSFESSRRETDTMRLLEEATDTYYEDFKTTMPKRDAQKMYDDVKKMLAGISNMSPTERPQRPANQERLRVVSERLNELIKDLTEVLK